MALRTTIESIGPLSVLSVQGDVDLSTVPTLHQVVSELVATHRAEIVAVDLDGVDALDDVGLGILLGAAGRARDQGGDVVLICASPRLRGRLALTRLDRAMVVHPTATDAATSIRRG